jgi:hypothetical protein
MFRESTRGDSLGAEMISILGLGHCLDHSLNWPQFGQKRRRHLNLSRRINCNYRESSLMTHGDIYFGGFSSTTTQSGHYLSSPGSSQALV